MWCNWQVIAQYTDPDTELEYPEPMYVCTNCQVKTSEAPAPSGRANLSLVSGATNVEAYAAPRLVDMLSSQRPASTWGSPGDQQRSALRAVLANWIGKEYRVTINSLGGRLYVNRMEECKRAADAFVANPVAKRQHIE